MIHPCFNFDDDTDEIVKIPRDEDLYMKVHTVEFRELVSENIEESFMEVKLGAYVITHYKLFDGRYAYLCVFFDEKNLKTREPTADCGSSQRVYENGQYVYPEDYIVWLKGRR